MDIPRRHLRVLRWAVAAIVAIGLLAAPRPATALDQLPHEDAGMAMLLLLSLSQALRGDPATMPAPKPGTKPVPMAALEPAAASPEAVATAVDTATVDTGVGSTGVDNIAPAGQ